MRLVENHLLMYFSYFLVLAELVFRVGVSFCFAGVSVSSQEVIEVDGLLGLVFGNNVVIELLFVLIGTSFSFKVRPGQHLAHVDCPGFLSTLREFYVWEV